MSSALFAQATDYYTTNGANNVGATGGFALFMVPVLVFVVITVVGMWKMFEKADKPGWAAIIPIYNLYILLQIAEKPSWWLVFMLASLIPFLGFFVSVAFSIIIGIEVAKRFGKSEVFGAILCGLLSIGYLIIGFGPNKYQPLGTSTSADPVPPTTPTPPVNPIS